MKFLISIKIYHMKTISTPVLRNSSLGFLLLLASMVLPVGAQTSHIVDVTNNVFTPDQLTVSVGDTVIWTNSEGNHNVNGTQATFPSNPESFGNDVGVGWTFSHVFSIPGTYDYQCDPHAGFGMVGQVVVEGSAENMLTINFTGMTPHVGQTLWLMVEDRDEGNELLRMTRVIEESFTVEVPGIVAGNDYRVEFFADHNGNGGYDDPPTDHAWRYDLDAVSENEVLDFTHNTNFQDIDWDHRVVLNLSSMAPHVGQEIYFALIDAATGDVDDRESEIVSESFTVELSKSMSGGTYRVDFFSDHNGNGYYDAPPTDHAWRLEFESSAGDDTLNFVHNTNFTDVMWKHRLRVRFSGMTPHLGQMFTLYVRDLASGTYLDTVVLESIEDADFDLESHVVEPGTSYQVDFFADHNGNGSYDAPPLDHAWRLESGVAMGDVELDFIHNTNFTDIFVSTGFDTESSELQRLKVYPNPATDYIHIEAEATIESLSLYNMTGSQLLQLRGLNSKFLTLSLDEIRSGIYFLKIETEDQLSMIKRLVKQ
jgi:plastocyanin